MLFIGLFIIETIAFYALGHAELPSVLATIISFNGWWMCVALTYLLCGLRIVNEWERVPVLRLGKYANTSGPGLVWNDPILHSYLEPVSIQADTTEIEVENVRTRDNIPISFKLMLTSRVNVDNVRDFVVMLTNGEDSIDNRAIASATSQVGRTELDSIQHSREDISRSIAEKLQGSVAVWGIIIDAAEITDIKVTDASIELAIAMKARAQKEAEAEMVRAEMQKAIAEKLKEAAGVFDDDAWRLKNLEVLLELCRSANNNTFIIGSDLLSGLNDIIPDVKKGLTKKNGAAVQA